MAEKNVGIEVGITPKRAGAQQTKKDISDIRKEVGQLNKSLTKSESQIGKTGGSASGMARSFAGAIPALLGVGSALAVVSSASQKIRQSIEEFRSFETRLLVTKAVSGSTAAEMEILRARVRELGETTVFTAAQVASGAERLARAGQDVNTILGSLPAVLDLAVAGEIDLAEASTIVAKALGAFKLPTEEAVTIADVLAKTANSVTTNITELGDALRTSGGIASGFGLSFATTTAAVATLSQVGLAGAFGGTALKSSLAQLADLSKEGERALKNIGLSAEDVSPALNDLGTILHRLADAGLSMTDALVIAGTRGGPGLSLLVENIDLFDQLQQKLKDAGGTSSRVSEEIRSGLDGALKELASASESVRISFAEGLAPALEATARGLASTKRDATGAAHALGELAGAILTIPEGFDKNFQPSNRTLLQGFFEDISKGVKDSREQLRTLAVYIDALANTRGINERLELDIDLKKQQEPFVRAVERFNAAKKESNSLTLEEIRLRAKINEATALELALLQAADEEEKERQKNRKQNQVEVDAFVKKLISARDELLALSEAAKEGGDEFDIISEAIAAGINPATELTTKLRALIEQIIRLRKEAIDPRELARSISGFGKGIVDLTGRPGEAGGSIAGDITDAELATRRLISAQETVRDLLRETSTVQERIAQIEAESIERQRKIREFAERRNLPQEELNRLLEREAQLREGLIKNVKASGSATAEVVRLLARTLGSAFGATGDKLESIANSTLDLVTAIRQFRSLPSDASRSQRALSGAAVGGGIGGLADQLLGGEGFGGLFGSAGGAIAGAAGLTGPWGLALAGGLAIIGSQIKRGADEGIAEVRAGVDGAVTSITKQEGGLGSQVKRIADAISDTIEDVIGGLGGSLVGFPEFGVKVRDDVVSVFIGGITKRFKDVQEAIDFAIREGLRLADTVGLAPEVSTALRGGRPESLGELSQLLDTAQLIADLRESGGVLSDVTAKVRDLTRAYFEQAEAMREAGVATELLGRNLVTSLGRLKDSLLGRQENPVDQLIADLNAFDRELDRALEQIERRIREVAERIANAGGIGAEDIARSGDFEDRLRALQELTGRLPGVEPEDVAALNRELTELKDLFEELGQQRISPEERRRAIRQEREAQAERRRTLQEAVQQEAAGFGFEGLAETLRQASLFVEEFRKKIEEAGFGAEQAAELLAQAESEAERRRQRAEDDFRSQLDDFLGSPLVNAIRGVREQADALVQGLQDLADAGRITAEELEIALGRIERETRRQQVDAGENAGLGLLSDALQFLGRSEEAERVRFELSKAELQIRFIQLQLAQRELGLRFEFFNDLRGLIGELSNLTFDEFLAQQQGDIGDAFRPVTQSFSDTIDRLRRAVESLRDAQRDLLTDPNLSPLLPRERLALLRDELNDLLRRAERGDVGAIEALPNAQREFLELLREISPRGTAEFQREFEGVNARIEAILERFGNVVNDPVARQTAVLRDTQRARFLQAAENDKRRDDILSEQTELLREQALRIRDLTGELKTRRLNNTEPPSPTRIPSRDLEPRRAA